MKFIDNLKRQGIEQAALEDKNISFTIDEDLKAQGFLRLYLEITKESLIDRIPDQFLPLKLTVSFPDTYPFFRPMIYASDIELPRHQNLIDKNLCLLPRSSSFWLPETLLADHLEEQLPKLFEQGMIVDPDALQEKPDEQAEPVSEYYPAFPQASIIFDTSNFDQLETARSPIEFLGTVKIGFPADAEVPCRLLVSESYDKDGNLLGKLPDNVTRIFTPRATGSIYRLEERPPTGIPDKDYQYINELLSNQHKKIIKFKREITLKHAHSITNVIGLTFPEEHNPGKISWGWLFLVTGVIVRKNAKGKKLQEHFIYYSKVNRIDSQELSFRIPQLKPLEDKTVAIFGLGALGAPSAIELAKNGIKQIRLIDFDIVNAGTTVRWPLGLSVAGMFKTDAVEKFINDNYPFVEIQKFKFRLGDVVIGEGELNPTSLPPSNYLDSILNEVSLIYDSTAEAGVTHFLAVEAQNRKVPFLSIYGTKGVWGGAVMRHIPDVTDGCWMCFQYALQDGTILMPPADDKGSIQTAGCGDISFIGTSFELENISNSGVRLAISTLCRDKEGYSVMNDDVGILSLVDENQTPIFPNWTTYKLLKHANCPYCNNQL